MDDQVLVEAELVARTGLERQGDAAVAADVADLAMFREVAGDDLVAVQPDPHD